MRQICGDIILLFFQLGVCIAIYDRKLQSYLSTFSVKKATVLSMMIWLGLLFLRTLYCIIRVGIC